MLMIFFFVMPATVSGFGNLLLPVLASVPEMVFPKINNVGLMYMPIYIRPALSPPDPGSTDLGSGGLVPTPALGLQVRGGY